MSRKRKAVSLPILISLSCLFWLSILSSQVEAQVEAFTGQPFGIGRIVLRVQDDQLPQPLGVAGITISEADGRLFYPVIETPPDTTIVRKLLVESPLMRAGPLRREVGGILQAFLDQTPPTTIYFLFKGSEPLQLTIGTKTPQRRIVRPLRSQQGLNRLAQGWWKQYTAGPKTIFGIKKSDYPPVVRSYLESMLSARLGLPLPPLEDKDPTQAMLEEQLGLLLGTEAIQTAMIRDRMLGDASLSEKADLPLPVAKTWPPLADLQVEKDVKIEPIAMRVPEECFYIRFGSYANFLWMQDTMKRFGGDAGNLISLRGLDYEGTKRMEEHLIVKQTVLGRMLGGTLISDVAMIGTDLFMREGASFGLLFEARNTFLLDRDFKANRAARVKEGGVTEETVTIDDKKVSFIHSEDDTVRSFYLADNGYVLITSSKEVMRRFIATGQKKSEQGEAEQKNLDQEPADQKKSKQGPADQKKSEQGSTDQEKSEQGPADQKKSKGGSEVGSLGATDEFRHARSVMPTSREDTVFAYFSDAFFRNMASPHYWVEVRRRLQAVADIEVLQMARLAGAGEGVSVRQAAPYKETTVRQAADGKRGTRPHAVDGKKGTGQQAVPVAEVADLKRLKLLPQNFGPRPDGSEPVLDSQGRLVDSLRGRRGFFVPISDVPVKKITAAEATAYRRFLSFYHEKWGRLDPMIVGVRREDIGQGQDRITVDAQANPFAKKHYETLIRRTGPAESRQLAPVEGNIIDFQVVLPDQYLFVGLQDVQLPSMATGQSVAPGGGSGRVALGRIAPGAAPPKPKVGLTDIFVGYIGTTGELGILNLFQALVMPAERSPSQPLLGQQLHKVNRGQFTLFSFQKWLLERVRPQLHFVESKPKRPAQLRLNVGDVARAKITPTLNRLSYLRTRTTSLGNLRLLGSLQQQLHVPAKECLTVAENLLDATLVCPLGGKYELRREQSGSDRDGAERWTSTSLKSISDDSPLEISVPRGYVGPPLNWFRGLKLDVTMTPKLFSVHAELIMKLPK